MRKRIRERNRTWETRRSLLSITFHHPRGQAHSPSLFIPPSAQHHHHCQFSPGHLGLLTNVYPALLQSALHGGSPHKHPSCCRPQETLPVTVCLIYELQCLRIAPSVCFFNGCLWSSHYKGILLRVYAVFSFPFSFLF